MDQAEKVYGGDPHLKLIRNPVNEGFSGGNNTGYKHTRGKYIVFLNNDTIVDPEWIEPMVEVMEHDPTVGLTQSLILNIDGQTIQNAGWLFSSYLIHKHPLCSGKPSSLRFQPSFEISFGCGASLMVRREVAEEMGLFDSSMPFFYDDTLLSLKTWLAQRRVVTVAASRIRHISGATKVWKIRFTTFHLLKSNLCLLFDVYPNLSDLTGAFTIHGLYLSTSSVFSLKKKDVDAVLGNLDALFWGLRNLRFLWRNRLSHKQKTKIQPGELHEKFVRIRLPVPYYFLPSKLSRSCFLMEVKRCEETVLQT
jgi:GT2 family glycosyltransferase